MVLIKNRVGKTYTEEEYFELEGRSVEKHEFHNGKITKMAGADPIHNIIASRIIFELIKLLDEKEGDFIVMNSDTRIKIPKLNKYVYPDAVVVCKEIEVYEKDACTILNPILIVEVLSPSTAEYGRTNKFELYSIIPSFKEYLLVAQDQPWTATFFRKASNIWVNTAVEGLDSSIHLSSVNVSLNLSDIYKKIEFPNENKATN